MNLSGKRLLVLGCTNNASDVQRFAKKENVKIILAGLYFGREIEEIADEKYYIDAYDKEALKQIIREKNIDGVFVGGNENIISRVIDVAEDLGLPFYSSRELWDTLMNKKKFKQACRDHGVPTMEDYEIDENDLEGSARKLPYPVVIKPVDNSGSTGVSKCENAQDFVRMYQFAKENSKTGEVTVEEFSDGFEICTYYTFVDGKPSLSSMTDKYVRGNKDHFIPLAEVYAYPSRYLPAFKEQVDGNMRRMLTDLGIKNGITSMQAMVDKDGKFKFFEMGYRLGGTAQYRYTEYVNGINSFFMMMAHALTGKMDGYDQSLDTADFSMPCATLTLMSKGGKIARIEGLEEARKKEGVLFIEDRYRVGDTIKPLRPMSAFHFRAYLVGKDVQDIKDLINYIQNTIKAYDENGESMLITHFDTNKLDFGDNKFGA